MDRSNTFFTQMMLFVWCAALLGAVFYSVWILLPVAGATYVVYSIFDGLREANEPDRANYDEQINQASESKEHVASVKPRSAVGLTKCQESYRSSNNKAVQQHRRDCVHSSCICGAKNDSQSRKKWRTRRVKSDRSKVIGT